MSPGQPCAGGGLVWEVVQCPGWCEQQGLGWSWFWRDTCPVLLQSRGRVPELGFTTGVPQLRFHGWGSELGLRAGVHSWDQS